MFIIGGLFLAVPFGVLRVSLLLDSIKIESELMWN